MQPQSERALVIINNAAARARRAVPHVKQRLAQSGVRFDADEPGAPGDVELRVRAALREGYRTIAVVGGDGTLSEAARGFFEPPAGTSVDGDDDAPPPPIDATASLAILPAGTGDDFARGLTGGRRASLDEWLARFIRHCAAAGNTAGINSLRASSLPQTQTTTRVVDTLYAKVVLGVGAGACRFVCLNAVTLGIGAEVAARVAAQSRAVRRLPGEARFGMAAAGALAAWRNRRARVRVGDDEPLECTTNLIAVTNGAYAGGGMHFAPSARPDDGRLDVVVACDVSRAGVVRELARIHRAGHLANPKVVVRSGTRVRVETLEPATLAVEADGDPRGHTPADFRIMPAALRVVV